ncbi:MAG: radical SAM protein [Comamonadaceae bacterium]|nr:radical SAM protein [Comamonadaceae bacterium]
MTAQSEFPIKIYPSRPRQEENATLDSLPRDAIIKSCDYIEMASCFAPEGIRCCVHGTHGGPLIAKKEDLQNNSISHAAIVSRRTEILEIINDLRKGEELPCTSCSNLQEKKLSNIDLSHLGGKKLPAGMNIQHYTSCNQRCTYCIFTVEDFWVKSQYDPIEYFEIFKKIGKLRGGNWIDFSGGETSLLKDFDRILEYLINNDLGPVVIYTNATFFKQSIFDALKNNIPDPQKDNRIILTTSLDTGLPSTYRKIRGSRDYEKVIANLLRYKQSGSKNIWLKYVITKDNQTDDDLWSFIFMMGMLRPERVMICPDFPYGEPEVPPEMVQFAAKLWCLIEDVVGSRVIDYTMDFGAPIWVKYHADLPVAREEVRKKLSSIGFPGTQKQ